MLLAKLIELVLRQASEMVSLALISLAILISTANPHIDGGNDANYLEGNANRDTRDILRPILLGED